ncbi:hypothetical protein QBC46DRAFT_384838 [Diplogelasinospora grovesii]|uniref:THIF-type NAD/FAD binding fold domain-containing protein n=1 Tax=Diplogelasinospora grovesii TaxID=303347 RepID=A0AAN6S5F9_9PEZI|nr:hypothetical protein QBC46DRAFT_384838 [Diplogelasinospora grovesii]
MASNTSKMQLAATAVISGAAVAAAILGYQRLQQEERLSRLKGSIDAPVDESIESAVREKQPRSLGPLPKLDKEDARNQVLAQRAQNGDFDDELILEQLARNRVFVGEEGLRKLRNAFVVVVGCGGVGSHATAAFARSGVSRLRLVDFDQVTLSSLNRHAVATLADVGLPKVQVLQRRLMAIAPWVRFDLRSEKFDGASAPALLGPWDQDGDGRLPDFVVDAIDNIESKVELLKYCHDHDLPVISSMGAGTKSDPTRIMVGDIGASTDDGLSRACRRRLKLLGVTSGIPVVYSTEKMGEGKAALLPLPEEEFQKGSVGDLGVLPDFRVRILPVLGTMPAVFGLTAANHVILKITGYPIDYLPAKARDKMYDSITAFVQSSEEKLVRATTKSTTGGGDIGLGLKVPITTGDVAFLVEELYRARSAVTGIPTKLVLVRWRKPQDGSSTLLRLTTKGEDGVSEMEQKSSNVRLRDLVCMTKEEATRHLNEVLLGTKAHEDIYDPSVIQTVEARLKDAEAYERYRQ